MAELPRGTVTLLFTDIEGSTRLLQQLGEDRYVRALEDHRRLLRAAFTALGGVEVEMQGDAFHFAFSDALAAVLAAARAQQALAEHPWDGEPILVRIGVHTGVPLATGHLYAGIDVHRASRVMSAGHGGQILVSETTYALVESSLPDGLSVRDLGEHRLKDLSAPQRLFQIGDGDFPPLASLYQTNLPIPATPFLGRERELQEVSALLDDDRVRLLTLTGAGGTGKTRLAAQAATEVSEHFPNGIYWVGLSSLRDPALVTTTAAQVLGSSEDLASFIGSKRLLLLFDNFEHLIEASTELAALLARCPGLTLLVTSREPLRISAEREYAVLPLREADAVLLFGERAQAAGVAVIEDGAIAEICRRLDHLPLAIELAAARVKVLPPAVLLERLERRLPLLTGGARDVPERQRTLRTTIDWSYELLGPDGQRLFARLAVFAGGCSLDAAEEICDANLDTVQSLVDKSLLRRSDERFWMLETIKEYAAEQLARAGEAEHIRRRHTDWFVSLAERAHPHLRGPEQASWVERMEREHGNFRLALESSLGADLDLGLRLASLLWRFWFIRGHLSEGRYWLERTLSAEGATPARAQVLRGLAIILMEQGENDRAAEAAEEALVLDRSAGDEDGAAQSAGILADLVAFRGDLATAQALYEEAAEIARRRGDDLELAITLYNLGNAARLQGDLKLAEESLEEALTIFGELDDPAGQASALQGLAGVAGAHRDHSQALSILDRSTQLFLSIRHVSGLLEALTLFAGLLADVGEAEASARLWGAYHALGDEIGRGRVHPLEAAAHDKSVASARSALGDEAFERAWAEGGVMNLDAAVAYALERESSAPTRSR